MADTLSEASDGATVLVGPMFVVEEINIDIPGLSIIMEGGWDCNSGSRIGTMSTIQGSMVITGGSVIMDGVTIE